MQCSHLCLCNIIFTSISWEESKGKCIYIVFYNCIINFYDTFCFLMWVQIIFWGWSLMTKLWFLAWTTSSNIHFKSSCSEISRSIYILLQNLKDCFSGCKIFDWQHFFFKHFEDVIICLLLQYFWWEIFLLLCIWV
jgi:hypothetical protein